LADTYAVVAGFVQDFGNPDKAVTERDANGKAVREVTVRALGTQKNVRITIWPEYKDTPIGAGDFIVAEGKFTQNLGQAQDGSPREYLNLSASRLLVTPSAVGAPREVISGPSKPTAAEDKVPF
jgi:hypothetical protein